MYEIRNLRVVKSTHSSIQWDCEATGQYYCEIHQISNDPETGREVNSYITQIQHPHKKLKLASLRKRGLSDGKYVLSVNASLDNTDGQTARLIFSIENGDLVATEDQTEKSTQASQQKDAAEKKEEGPCLMQDKKNEVVTSDTAQKKSEPVAIIEDLAIVDIGSNKGTQIRWTALPSSKYLVRIVRLRGHTSVILGKDQTLETNGVKFGNLENKQDYRVSVSGYNQNNERGPWESLIFHVEDGKMILGRRPQQTKREEFQSPPSTQTPTPATPPSPTPEPQVQKDETRNNVPQPKPDPAVQQLEEALKKEQEKNAELNRTIQENIARMLANTQSETNFEQALRGLQEQTRRERQELEQRTATEREQRERRENERQAAFEQTVQRLREEVEEARRVTAAARAAATPAPAPQPAPATPPQPVATTATGTTPPQAPTTPVAPVTPVTGTTGGTPANGNTPPATPQRRWPWERIWAALGALALILVIIFLANKWLLKPQSSVPNQEIADLKNQLIENQVVLKKLLETSNAVAGAKSPVTIHSPADVQVGGDKISVRPTDPATWSTKGGKVSHSGNTTTAHTIIGVVNNGEIKNSTIRVMSSEVWTSEWTPTLPTVTCGKEVNAGTNEFVIGPREVQCIMVPIGWLVQPCLEELINIDMMCGDDALARTYLPGTKEQTHLKGNQMRFRLKSHISQEVTVHLRVINP